jgi:hypothetical protein
MQPPLEYFEYPRLLSGSGRSDIHSNSNAKRRTPRAYNMHSSPPPTHSSDADDAYYEGQPLTSGADRSLQAQRPSTSYGPPHSTSELYPEFYSDLFQPASSDWPLQDDHPSTSSRQQYSSSTPHLRDQYQSPAPAPLAAFHNPSAPVLRERPVKKSSLDNFKGGLKSLFKKNKGPKIGTPYSMCVLSLNA